ncbi:MAG: NAD(P)-dependent malic enzyme [Candidatus Micrarchaeia archaeon]
MNDADINMNPAAVLDAHKKSRGKLEMFPKVKVQSKADLATYYTPGVAYVAKEISRDRSKVYDFTSKGDTIAIISDGTRLLGLGSVGAEASMPVMEMKALLYKKYAGIDAVPLCLNTTSEAEIVAIAKGVAPSFGGINIEDIESPKCFEIVEKLSNTLDIPVLHDDQHGTAMVMMAALINAAKLAGKDLKSSKIVINGAGAAGLGFARILSNIGLRNVYVLDTAGLIYKGRKEHMNRFKEEIASITNPEAKSGTLEEIVEGASVLIGASTAKVFTKDMIAKMADKPIVFALANPEPEISYSDAIEAGAFIAATGRSDSPNQVNNMFSFPAIMRGLLSARVRTVTYDLLYEAAKALAKSAGKNLSREHILPDASDSKQMLKAVESIAIAVAQKGIDTGNARLNVTPQEIKEAIRQKAKAYAKIEKKLPA